MSMPHDASRLTIDATWHRTHCSRMDHGGCTLDVAVSSGSIVDIRPVSDGILSRGHICSKAMASVEKRSSPHRLLTPLQRIGKRGEGRWKPIPWPEALDTIAFSLKRIRHRWGARSVVFCQGMPKGLEHFLLIRLAHSFGSPNIAAVQDVCHAPREVCGLHTCGFFPVVDLRHQSRSILIWGANPFATNEEGVFSSLLRKQIQNGCRITVVDPCRTKAAEQAEVFLQIRPGTDAALALALLHVVLTEKRYDEAFVRDWTIGFEDLYKHCEAYTPERVARHCGIDADAIRSCARLYAMQKPSALLWGNAIEQHPTSWHTIRALICLMAVCGNLDVAGGNVHALEPPVLGMGSFVRSDLVPDKVREMIHAFHGVIPRMMTVPSAFWRKAVLDSVPYPIRGAYIQCANPLIGYAESRLTRKALMALDFLAVSDVVMTPTAELADIVLPAATQFEFDDIGHYGLGHGIVLARPKLLDPPGVCKPDLWILNEIGKRVSSPDLWFHDIRDMLDTVLEPSGLRYTEFVEKGYLEGKWIERKYLNEGFRTRSKKVDLRLDNAQKWGLDPLPQADILEDERSNACSQKGMLLLTSAKSPYYLHSSYRWIGRLHQKEPLPVCRIHPDTARGAGIAPGDRVRITTSSGSFIQWAELTDTIRTDVVLAASGWWRSHDGHVDLSANYNQATSAFPVGKAFGTPMLKGIPCTIEPVSDDSDDAMPVGSKAIRCSFES